MGLLHSAPMCCLLFAWLSSSRAVSKRSEFSVPVGNRSLSVESLDKRISSVWMRSLRRSHRTGDSRMCSVTVLVSLLRGFQSWQIPGPWGMYVPPPPADFQMHVSKCRNLSCAYSRGAVGGMWRSGAVLPSWLRLGLCPQPPLNIATPPDPKETTFPCSEEPALYESSSILSYIGFSKLFQFMF